MQQFQPSHPEEKNICVPSFATKAFIYIQFTIVKAKCPYLSRKTKWNKLISLI
jgi:hypothetical protein